MQDHITTGFGIYKQPASERPNPQCENIDSTGAEVEQKATPLAGFVDGEASTLAYANKRLLRNDAEIARLREENEELRKDAERLLYVLNKCLIIRQRVKCNTQLQCVADIDGQMRADGR